MGGDCFCQIYARLHIRARRQRPNVVRPADDLLWAAVGNNGCSDTVCAAVLAHGGQLLVYFDIVLCHPMSGEALLKPATHSSSVECQHAADLADRLVHAVNDMAGYAVLYHLGYRAMPEGKYRRAA